MLVVSSLATVVVDVSLFVLLTGVVLLSVVLVVLSVVVSVVPSVDVVVFVVAVVVLKGFGRLRRPFCILGIPFYDFPTWEGFVEGIWKP